MTKLDDDDNSIITSQYVDYTNATAFETLTSAIEDILMYQIKNPALPQSFSIAYDLDVPIQLHYKINSQDNNSLLTQWFDLPKDAPYLVLTHQQNQYFQDTSVNLFLSALSLAASSSTVVEKQSKGYPSFVATGPNEAYVGFYKAEAGVTLRYQVDRVMDSLHSNQSCVSGLLDFFHLKLGRHQSSSKVSVKFEYFKPIESKQRNLRSAMNGITLQLSWPSLVEGMYVDNAVHSSLCPKDAPVWKCNIVTTSAPSRFKKPFFKSVLNAYQQSFKEPVKSIIAFDALKSPVTASVFEIGDKTPLPSPPPMVLQHTSPPTSLLHRLLSAMKDNRCHTLEKVVGAFKQFVSVCRNEYWERRVTIPYLQNSDDSSTDDDNTYPDLSTCLLYQKLQMLNCCIAKKRVEEEEEEQFFDTVSENHQHRNNTSPSKHQGKVLRSLVSNTPLVFPSTVSNIPITEDILSQQQQVLINLMSLRSIEKDDDFVSDRVENQVKCNNPLLSDMAKFKEMNPTAVLADFIRAYRPLDWTSWKSLTTVEAEYYTSLSTTDDVVPADIRGYWPNVGVLCERMQTAGNVWAFYWQNARSCFSSISYWDANSEAEKILHSLEHLTCNQLLHQLSVNAIAMSYEEITTDCNDSNIEVINRSKDVLCTLAQHTVSALDEAGDMVEKSMDDKKERDTALVLSEMALDRASQWWEQVEDLRTATGHVFDLFELDFPPDLVNRLIVASSSSSQATGCVVQNDKEKELVSKLFQSLDEEGSLVWQQPSCREYVLRNEMKDRPFYKLGGNCSDNDSSSSSNSLQVVKNQLVAIFKNDTVRFALTLGDTEY